MLSLGGLAAAFHRIPGLVLLEVGVASRLPLLITVHLNVLATIGLAGGPAAVAAAAGAEQATAHLVGQETAAWAEEADATLAADSAAWQAALTFPLQTSGCTGLSWPAFGS